MWETASQGRSSCLDPEKTVMHRNALVLVERRVWRALEFAPFVRQYPCSPSSHGICRVRTVEVC